MTHPLLQILDALAQAQRGVDAAPAASADAAITSNPIDTASSLIDRGRLLLRLFEESDRINKALFQLIVLPQLRVPVAGIHQSELSAPTNNNHGEAHPRDEDDLFDILSGIQRWILEHPVVAQAIFSSLVAEGRQFAGTGAGAQWASALAESELVRRGRQVWEATTLNLLEEHGGAVLPSAYLDVLRKAVLAKDFEGLVARLRQGTREDFE